MTLNLALGLGVSEQGLGEGSGFRYCEIWAVGVGKCLVEFVLLGFAC